MSEKFQYGLLAGMAGATILVSMIKKGTINLFPEDRMGHIVSWASFDNDNKLYYYMGHLAEDGEIHGELNMRPHISGTLILHQTVLDAEYNRISEKNGKRYFRGVNTGGNIRYPGRVHINVPPSRLDTYIYY